MELKENLYDVLIEFVETGEMSDPQKLTYAIEDAAKIVKHICDFVEENGELALACGGEWLYQSDEGQANALELVSWILDDLNEYADESEWED